MPSAVAVHSGDDRVVSAIGIGDDFEAGKPVVHQERTRSDAFGVAVRTWLVALPCKLATHLLRPALRRLGVTSPLERCSVDFRNAFDLDVLPKSGMRPTR
jgi:hypothetical protein